MKSSKINNYYTVVEKKKIKRINHVDFETFKKNIVHFTCIPEREFHVVFPIYHLVWIDLKPSQLQDHYKINWTFKKFTMFRYSVIYIYIFFYIIIFLRGKIIICL